MKVFFGSENISDLIQNSMDKIKTIMESSTVIGEKIVTDDGTTILPVSKVTMGYVVGGGEYGDSGKKKNANRFPMTGGSSGGISVTPVGFLIETNGEIKYINVENKTAYQTILNMFNAILRKVEAENDKEEDPYHGSNNWWN